MSLALERKQNSVTTAAFGYFGEADLSKLSELTNAELVTQIRDANHVADPGWLIQARVSGNAGSAGCKCGTPENRN